MRVLAVLTIVMLSGCGAPVPACDGGIVLGDAGCRVAPRAGAECSSAGFWCESVSTALECKGTTWEALPCRGPGGCAIDAGLVSCDLNGALADDRCASTAEGRGLCTGDGLGTLECRGGVFVKTNVCRSCTQSGDTVTCIP